jgi:hypothetical protein
VKSYGFRGRTAFISARIHHTAINSSSRRRRAPASSQTIYLLHDHLGSTDVITDATGADSLLIRRLGA